MSIRVESMKPIRQIADKVQRIARYLIRLSRRVTENREKTDYQMQLVYKILEIQGIKIKGNYIFDFRRSA